MPWRHHERVAVALIGLAIGGYLLVSQDYRFGSAGHPGPGFFPIVVAAAGLALSGFCLAWPDGGARFETKPGALVFVCALVVFGLVIEIAGFIPAGIVFTGLMVRLLGSRSPWQIGAVAISAPVGLHLLFDRGFGISLPKGLLAWML